MAELEIGHAINQAKLDETLASIDALIGQVNGQANFAKGSEDYYWTWPVAALSQFPIDLIRKHLIPKPGKILLQESLDIELLNMPKQLETYVLNGKLTGADNVGIEFCLDSQSKTFASMRTRLRYLPSNFLANQKTIRAPKADPAANLISATSAQVFQERVDQFVELLNDLNPLHRDRDYAQQLGLQATVIPGTLMAFMLQSACGPASKARRLRRLSMRFLAPILVGSSISTRVLTRNIEGNRLRVLFTGPDNQLAAIADLVLAKEGGEAVADAS